ncbi:MAG: hypothetical protein JWO08_1815, partial [Verrucomicrobiaceae bacterium]|nr:hypothetical protein [Verrucomicrobiaceae bacterium]
MVGSQSAIGTELFKLANVRTAPFAISQSPLPLTQTLAPGATVTYTAAATAVSGVTLTYQWRRNGLGIPGATKATYTFKAAENLEGTYDLLVRSGDFELISGAAQLSVTDPAKIAITQQPLARLARVFDPVTFKVSVVGQSPSFQWYKGAVPIPGATTSVLSLPFVFNADAGLYKVKVSNSLGSVFSAAVPLVLVGSTDTNLPVKNLTTATMKAPVIGAVSGLTYQWLSGSSALTNGAFNKRINGVTTPTLTFTKFTSADRYFFTCVVTMGSQSVLSGRIYPQVADIPIIAVKPSPPTWIISGGVFQFASSTLFTQSNLTGKPWNFPTIYNITGLPLGMTYDTKTGLITGRPQAGGGTSITLKIKVGNVAGTMTTALTVTIPIETFPALVKGAFRGLADRSTTTLNDNLGNYFQADVTALGSLSGKLFRGTTAYPFTTRFVDTTTGSLFATADVKISRPGTTPLTLTIVFDGNTGAVTGNLTDGTDTTPITGVRSPWIATGVGANPATAYAKAYTAALQLPDAQTGDGAYPQGDAYAVASITNAGAASGAVRLADGTKVTFSTLLGGAGQLPLHVGAYANTGSLHGWSTITSGTGNWDGIPGFFKAMQRRESTTRSYKSGVPLHTLTLIGGTWTKPTAAALLLGVTDSGATVGANNARIEFTEGGISSSHLAVAGKYAVPLRIKAPASAFVLPPVAGNPGKLTLAFATLLTGEITGTFTTTDANPNGGAAVPRTVSYYGVIVQRLNRGRGHFNLARLPDDFEVNPLKTGIIGGLMELSASQ